MSELTEFILARIVEDELRWADELEVLKLRGDTSERVVLIARVLAECMALRAVVEQCAEPAADPREDEHAIAFNVLDALAGIWSDHPDYRPEEWA